MGYFPKKTSSPISIMLAEINKQLGGAYFTVMFVDRFYTLNPTNKAIEENKYPFISIGKCTYSDMYHYLSGILVGLKAAAK